MLARSQGAELCRRGVGGSRAFFWRFGETRGVSIESGIEREVVVVAMRVDEL